MKRLFPALSLPLLSLVLLAAGPAQSASAPPSSPLAAAREGFYAIAIHGGAGTIPKTVPNEERVAYLKSLSTALEIGRDVLAKGGKSLDAVEKVVNYLEDDPLFNAGKGAVFTHDGTHELDAAIMNGRDLSCGAVAGLHTVKNPISLARLVMEKSPHVFLAGDGAERFAEAMGVTRVKPEYFFVQKRHDQWQEELKKEAAAEKAKAAYPPKKDRDTVGAVALDLHGDLAAATSTGGLTNKRYGRIGDVPVIGAGTYANNRTCAISGTGIGEEFIKHSVAHDISALMEYGGLTLQQAADRVVHEKLKAGDGGVIGVARDGSIALVFNSEGMFRGAADSKGRIEVAIW